MVSPERLEIFKTGVFYHITMSTVALSLSSLHPSSERGMKLVLIFMISGILIFSGSLYLLVLLDIPLLGAITPIGGTILIGSLLRASWVFKK